MKVDVGIRPLRDADIAVAARLYGRCFEDAWPESSIKSLLKTPGCWGLLAVEDGAETASGFLIARVIAREGEILAVGTDPQRQRRGIAARLLASAIVLAGEHADAFFLEVGDDNPAGKALYSGLGFEQIGRRKDYYRRATGEKVDALILRLELPKNQTP